MLQIYYKNPQFKNKMAIKSGFVHFEAEIVQYEVWSYCFRT